MFSAKFDGKKIRIYQDGKLIKEKGSKTEWKFISIFYDECSTERYNVMWFTHKTQQAAENKKYWLQGYNYKKYIVPVARLDVELSKQMGKFFLPPKGYKLV